MKILIVDDEHRGRKLLRTIIENSFVGNFEIFEAKNLITAVGLIKIENPEIVLLDIEMPKYSGTQIFNFFDESEINFTIIFTTAYEKYALDAIKLGASDYLLKPINPLELEAAIKKAKKQLHQNNITKKITSLEKKINNISMNILALEIPKGVIFVSYDDIVFFEADRMYTKVHMRNDRVELVSKPLKFFLDQLEGVSIFYKIHRSYMVNIKHIREMQNSNGNYLAMSNQRTLPIAKARKNNLLNMIKSTFINK